MTDFDRQSNESLTPAALLRLAADQELTAEQARRLEALAEADDGLSDAEARIEAERHLRAAVGRALGSEPAAPAGLHARVAAAMAAADLSEMTADVSSQTRQSNGSPSVPERMADQTRDRSFWSGTVARVGSLAAVLAVGVVATFVLFGPVGAPVDAVSSRTVSAQFVAREHGRCVIDIEPGTDKFRVDDVDSLPTFAQDVIGREVAIADLLAGGAENVAFVDAGPCGVPMGGRSMHVRFDVPLEAGDSTRVSLFVQQYTGEQELEAETTYEFDSAAGPGEPLKTPSIYTWLRDGLVYYLVIDRADACETIRTQMDAPATVKPLAGTV
ncbi:MAG: hypothetical protein AAGF47_00465 [Planctomycetota bacterium]